MSEINFDSTEMDTEFDILEEMIKTLKDIDSFCQKPADKEIREKINYMKFLLDELDDALKGEHEYLRRRRFIVKRTP